MNPIPNSTGLIAISFLGALGFFMNYCAARMTSDVGAQICTGVIDGAPVPTTQRWRMLYNQWVSYALGGFILTSPSRPYSCSPTRSLGLPV